MMNSVSNESRSVLAEFFKNISSKEGWWYALPTTSMQISTYLKFIKPQEISIEEINSVCSNFAKLYLLSIH